MDTFRKTLVTISFAVGILISTVLAVWDLALLLLFSTYSGNTLYLLSVSPGLLSLGGLVGMIWLRSRKSPLGTRRTALVAAVLLAFTGALAGNALLFAFTQGL